MMESLETGSYENHLEMEVPPISADKDTDANIKKRLQGHSNGSNSNLKQREESQTSATGDEEENAQETSSTKTIFPSALSFQPSCCTKIKSIKCIQTLRRILHNSIIHKILSLAAALLFMLLVKKAMKPSILHSFFIWMEDHPLKGLIAFLIVYPLHMVLMLPGAPLCMGAGFVFKLRYGWVGGVTFCSLITLLGSLVGSVICFLLGRFCFRNRVRRWSKRYPLFEPIDGAVTEHGFRVMVLVYLTPAVPLGPMSYMMGTTSMDLIDFAKAKIAALPMTILYVYLGAATGTLMTQGGVIGNANSGDVDHFNHDANLNGEIMDSTNGDHNANDVNHSNNGEPSGLVHKANFEEMALSPKLILSGILISMVIIAIISVKMKKELQKILDKQKKKSKDDREQEGVEMKNKGGSPISGNGKSNTRQRYHVDDSDLHQRPPITNNVAADNV